MPGLQRPTLNPKIPWSVLPWLIVAVSMWVIGVDILAPRLDVLVQQGILARHTVAYINWFWLLFNLGAWYIMIPGRTLLRSRPRTDVTGRYVHRAAITVVLFYWALAVLGWVWMFKQDN